MLLYYLIELELIVHFQLDILQNRWLGKGHSKIQRRYFFSFEIQR